MKEIEIELTERQHKPLKKVAERLGMSMSDVVRAVLVVAVLKEAAMEA